MDFYFNLKEAGIYRAVKWARHPVFSLAGFLQKIFFILFVLAFLPFLYGFLTFSFSEASNSALLGLSILFLTLGTYFKLITSFFNSKLKNPKIKNPNNLAEFLDFETAKAVEAADKFAQSPKSPPTNSTCLFHFLLEKTSGLEFIFSRDLLDIKAIKSMLESGMKEYLAKEKPGIGYSQDYQDTIRESLKIAKKRNHERVVVGDFLSALAIYNQIFQKILIDAALKKEDIDNLTWWLESLKKKIEERKKWLEYENLMRKGTLAKEWTAGY